MHYTRANDSRVVFVLVPPDASLSFRLCRKIAFSRQNPKIVYWKINDLRVQTFLFSVICDRARKRACSLEPGGRRLSSHRTVAPDSRVAEATAAPPITAGCRGVLLAVCVPVSIPNFPGACSRKAQAPIMPVIRGYPRQAFRRKGGMFTEMARIEVGYFCLHSA